MIRVEVTRSRGSTPREAGATMFVSAEITQGTIGGGQLEYMAIDRARQMLARDETTARMDIPLGPEIGQCCGGRVELTLTRVESLPAAPALPQVLIFGAGHVGRALARALALLPLRPILIDQRADELAQAGGETRLTPLPENEIRMISTNGTTKKIAKSSRSGAARSGATIDFLSTLPVPGP